MSMGSERMKKYEACASLLRRPLVSDGGRFAYFLQPDGQLQVFDGRSAAPFNPFRRIQASGVGQHCRWMLTDEALVVARPDRTFVAKRRPPELPWQGGYRSVFSFGMPDGDLIVLSGDASTHVVHVGVADMDEHTMALGVRCFAGCGSGATEYTLFGQTPLSAGGGVGSPTVVSVTAAGFRVQRFPATPAVALESIVAALPAASAALLIGAQLPSPPGMESYDRLEFPLPTDHDAWWVLPYQSGALVGTPIPVNEGQFIACGGPRGLERVFFQLDRKKLDPSQPATLISIDGRGTQTWHEVAGLSQRSSVSQIQFDPLVGWIGIAQEHESRDHYLLTSKDGMAWSAAVVGLESQPA